MTLAHIAMDVCLWICSTLWAIGFLARGPKPRKHNKRLRAPDPRCERTGDFEVKMHGSVFGRRQAN